MQEEPVGACGKRASAFQGTAVNAHSTVRNEFEKSELLIGTTGRFPQARQRPQVSAVAVGRPLTNSTECMSIFFQDVGLSPPLPSFFVRYHVCVPATHLD